MPPHIRQSSVNAPSRWFGCVTNRWFRSPESSASLTSCLGGWIARADIDDGYRPRPTSDERAELVGLRRKNRVLELEARSSNGPGLLRSEERPPRMIYAFIVERYSDLPVEQRCRALMASRSAFYMWRHQAGEADRPDGHRRRSRRTHRQGPRPIDRHLLDAGGLTPALRLGLGCEVNHKRVARLTRPQRRSPSTPGEGPHPQPGHRSPLR